MVLQEKYIDLQENDVVLQEKDIDLQENNIVSQVVRIKLLWFY